MNAKIYRLVTLPVSVTAEDLEKARRDPPRLFEKLLEMWAAARCDQDEARAFGDTL